MNDLIGTYGRIRSGGDVVSCSDERYDWSESEWWHTYLLCIAQDDETLTLKNYKDDATIVVRREGYGLLGMPHHHVGDRVTVAKSSKTATVSRVCWHMGRERFYYILDYGDRVSTNWFFDGDIEEA